jgi:hypothetical protein
MTSPVVKVEMTATGGHELVATVTATTLVSRGESGHVHKIREQGIIIWMTPGMFHLVVIVVTVVTQTTRNVQLLLIASDAGRATKSDIT